MLEMEKERSPASGRGIMDVLTEKLLDDAEQDKRFEFQVSELHSIEVYKSGADTHYEIAIIDQAGAQCSSLKAILTTSLRAGDASQMGTDPLLCGRLRCLFQPDRPEHRSRHPDKLPFENSNTCQSALRQLGIPTSYLQIADGNPAVAVSQHFRDRDRRTTKFEFISHCITKQGNWALSLSHEAKSCTTNVFWSVDRRIDSSRLLKELRDFQDYAYHPLLIPCIVFAWILHSNIDRRNSIKERLQQLENRIRAINKQVAQENGEGTWASRHLTPEPTNVENLFELLHSCRREQSSQEGRYDFWSSFHTAMLNGFDYFGEAMSSILDADCHRTHSELKQWATITWERLESLKARDKDHISRVDNASDMLYNLIHQRDSRIQANIAKATQRDSEDMKFIALLGSVFLPAGLVASILNVQEFQFLPGSKLFGVYVAIILPLIGFVVALCLSRPLWSGWDRKRCHNVCNP